MIYVVNKHRVPNKSGYFEYIGRPSALGNPYHIGEHGQRHEVIHSYGKWLQRRLSVTPDSKQAIELARLTEIARDHDLYLVCFCAPQACHGDVLKREIELRLR